MYVCVVTVSFSVQNPEAVVLANGRFVLSELLQHSSHRLVRAAIECARNISDVRSTADDSQLLYACMQLLGGQDALIVLYVVDTLANMCANNKRNKVH